MKGVDFNEVRDAIAAAFKPDEFDNLLKKRLKFDRPGKTVDEPFTEVVGKTLALAQEQGWDLLFIAEVAAARRLNQDIQKIYAQYAQAVVDDARQHLVEKGPLTTVVTVHTRGTANLAAPMRVTEAGLEKNVKPYLPMIEPALWGEQLLRATGRVCQVEVNNSARGTGFLVGPDTLLTNHHVVRDVIEKSALAPTVRLRFDYRVLANGTRSDGTIVSLHKSDWLIDATPCTAGERNNNPDATVPTIDELDFALLKLERAFGDEPLTAGSQGSPRGWIAVPKGEPLISIDPPMPVLILQHPQRGPIKLAIDTEAVLQLYENGTRVRYSTNTDPGSSGSPCFDMNWKLIALHHYGDPLHDKAQYNQGIPIKMIRDRLKRSGKEGALGGPTD
jgi:hypothetical protein